jgi:modulator of FtsH protease
MPYDPATMHEQWHEFFLGEAGAAAALAGMFFVAISINLSEIVKDRVLPGRAAETIAILTGALLTASLMLVPEQDTPWLGIELLVLGTAIWLVPVRIQMAARKVLDEHSQGTFPLRVLVTQLATLPAIAAAVLLMADAPAGFAILAIGILVTFVVSVANAWVLLVEILR